MTLEQPPSPDDDAPLDRCNIGKCHLYNACAFAPCRAPQPREHPYIGIGALALVLAAGMARWLWL